MAGRSGFTPRATVRAICVAAAWAGISVAHAAVSAWAPAAVAPAAATTQAVAVTPEIVAHDFYAWYLGELVKNQDPISVASPLLHRYVAPALLAEIDRKMHSPDGMDADYFIKAQDYLDGWATHVAVDKPSTKGDVATTVVTLGGKDAGQGEPWRLRVTLIKDTGGWKIRKVARI